MAPAASAALPLLRPTWRVPGVGAAMSMRAGGVSALPWASLNLGVAVGDDAQAVAENRRRLGAALGARPVWLRQVHGVQVLRLHADPASTPDAPEEPADAAWTTERGVACVVQVADCLPVLFAADDGRAVAAAHAGWRGLAAGVLEATLAALDRGAGVAPARVRAWLGPCIGPRAFEVGADVLAAFGADPTPGRMSARFVYRPRADGAPRWLADLAGLARDRLRAAGVGAVSGIGGPPESAPDGGGDGPGPCTFEAASDWFSFRRDGRTGRMAAAVWRL